MGLEDKIRNTADKAAGKAKEATGEAKDDERLRSEGRSEQGVADLKQAAEKAKDAFKR